MDIPSVITVLIPIFTSQLEKAKEATDMANIRAAYAEVVSNQLTGGDSTTKKVTLTQTKPGWQSDVDLPKNLTSTEGSKQPLGDGKQEVTITATDSGVTIDLAIEKAKS